MRVLKVSVQEEGQRLDRMLAKYMQLAPRSFFYKMLRKKNIKLNGKKADGSEKVAEGDEITLYLADDTYDSVIYIPSFWIIILFAASAKQKS